MVIYTLNHLNNTTTKPMENKQTAVEQLYDTIDNELIDFLENRIDVNELSVAMLQAKVKAKAMEMEQIIKAHGNKKRMTPTVGNYLETYTGEQYYKETYGKQ